MVAHAMGLKLGQLLIGCSSVFAPSLVPTFFVKINFVYKICLKFCGWVGVPIVPLGFLPGYRRWPFEGPYPHYCESQILGGLPYPRSPSHPGDANHLPTRQLQISILSHVPPHT